MKDKAPNKRIKKGGPTREMRREVKRDRMLLRELERKKKKVNNRTKRNHYN